MISHFVTHPLCASASPRETLIALAAVLLCVSAFAERQPIGRYQSVIDRQMFGPPPEGFDPTKRPDEVKGGREAQKAAQELTKEQEKLKSAIRFSMINVTPSGETAVGFTDSSEAKSPRHYYLKVGETSTDRKWTVREADPMASSMTIVSADGIEVALTIGGDSSKGSGRTSSGAARTAVAHADDARSSGGILGSLRSRRAQRRAEENARMEALNQKLQEREAALEKRQQEEAQRREEEKAQQKAEREEQRKQLLQIQDELRRTREAKDKSKPESEGENADE